MQFESPMFCLKTINRQIMGPDCIDSIKSIVALKTLKPTQFWVFYMNQSIIQKKTEIFENEIFETQVFRFQADCSFKYPLMILDINLSITSDSKIFDTPQPPLLV